MKYKVIVGSEFEISSTEVIGTDLVESVAKVAENEAKSRVRQLLVNVIFLFAAVSMAVATFIGLNDGTFNEVATVWSYAGPIVGLVLGYYFTESH